MLDIGWMELLVIGAVALIVVGPKELPGMFRTAGQYLGKARGMAREFQRSMEQAAEQSGMNETTRELRSLNRLNMGSPATAARKYVDDLAKDTKAAVEAPLPEAKPAKTPPAAAPESAPESAAEPTSGSAAEPHSPSQQTPS